MKKQLLYLIFIVISTIVLLSCISTDRNAKKADRGKIKSMQVNNQTETKLPMDYTPIPLPQLIGRADLIVMGKVTEIGDSIFAFQVEEFLFNEHTSNSLKVRKYIPSEIFDKRALPYGIDQEFILFLSTPKQNDGDHPWHILGFSGEGEMPIEEGFVYFEGSFVHGLEQKPYDVRGVSRNTQRFNLSDFKDTIQGYVACFSWESVKYIKNNKERERWQASKKCPDDSIKEYSDKSWINDYLVRETVNKIHKP